MRAELLDAIHPGPPTAGTDQFFGDDLLSFDRERLFEERRRLQLRLLLTHQSARDRWPAVWCSARLAKVEGLLR